MKLKNTEKKKKTGKQLCVGFMKQINPGSGC